MLDAVLPGGLFSGQILETWPCFKSICQKISFRFFDLFLALSQVGWPKINLFFLRWKSFLWRKSIYYSMFLGNTFAKFLWQTPYWIDAQ